MILARLSLQNFRNYSKREFEFSPTLTLIIGPNTAGKTNLLEALYLIATGSSFRGKIDREMIKLGEELARLQVRLKEDSEEMLLEIVLTTGSVQGRRSPYKRYLVNGVGRRKSDFVGNFYAVVFHPQDIELVTDSPSRRRTFLDNVLTQVSKKYARALTQYEKVLTRRNKLLSELQEKKYRSTVRTDQIDYRDTGRNEGNGQLEYWDRLLVENGQVLIEERKRFIEFLNSKKLSKNLPHLHQKFRHIFQFIVEYNKSSIGFEILKEYSKREFAAGYTLVGPHRDDFVIKTKNPASPAMPGGRWAGRQEPKTKNTDEKIKNNEYRDLSIYGSRGEQRLAVLWLRLGELAYSEAKTGGKPVLLLDDIFSELDHEHRRLVASIIPDYQTIITTADKHYVERLVKDKENSIKLIRLAE